MARKVVLLTYNIKPGTDLEEYREYTRSVDYGVFRQNPNIQSYSNFIIEKTVRGDGEWFRHFDLLFVDSFEEFNANGKLHFGDPAILEHAANWRIRWGQDEASGWRSNINISYADEIWG